MQSHAAENHVGTNGSKTRDQLPQNIRTVMSAIQTCQYRQKQKKIRFVGTFRVLLSEAYTRLCQCVISVWGHIPWCRVSQTSAWCTHKSVGVVPSCVWLLSWSKWSLVFCKVERTGVLASTRVLTMSHINLYLYVSLRGCCVTVCFHKLVLC